MEQLIPLINKLQDVFAAIGQNPIDLPQIVVVGSQSSGKSSVLESLVGRDFLPRGTGICTRRPLVLQLYTTQKTLDGPNPKEEWGEFLHLPSQKFYDFNEIRNEIQRETDRITGKNKGISNKSINLKIYSPYVLNLTLVDLPGITKVPTGDQPEDVEEQIRSMCLEFISNPNAIVLAVSSANQVILLSHDDDLVNSDGLKMARSVDPDGERTIGVLTKVDIMDQGTDCADILSNKVVPLRRGYIAVVNRSQKEIQDNIPIRAGLIKEQTYFQGHPKYRSLLSKCGTQNLARTLNQILIHHIRHCLPEIKSRIATMMADVQSDMDALGEPMDAGAGTKLGGILLRILSKFSANVSSSVEWNGSSHDGNIVMTELFGGARIAYIFSEVFGKRLRQFDALDGLSDEDIRTVMANANGPRQALLVSIQSFDVLVRTQIAKLEHPGLQCVDLIFDEMCRIAGHSITPELHRFPDLKDRVFEVVNKLLRSCMHPTQKMISNVIAVELAYLNIAHPDFIGGKQAVALAHQNRANMKQQQQLSSILTSPNGPTTIVPSMLTSDSNGVSNNLNTTSSTITSPMPNSNQNNSLTNGESSKKIVVMSSPTPQSNTNTNVNANANVSQSNPPIPASVGPQADGRGFLGLFRPASERIVTQTQPNTQVSAMTTPIRTQQPMNGVPMNGMPMNGYGSPILAMDSSMNTQKSNGIIPMDNNHVSSSSSGLVVLPQVPDRMRCGTNPNEREIVETDVIKTLITSYFEIVKKTYMDMVPKTIMHFLVNSFKDTLQNELVSQLYKENFISELMRETDDIASKRKACKDMRDLLQKAMEIVNEVRDYNALK